MKKETYQVKMQDILNLEQFEKLEKPRINSIDFTRKEEERINGTLRKVTGKRAN